MRYDDGRAASRSAVDLFEPPPCQVDHCRAARGSWPPWPSLVLWVGRRLCRPMSRRASSATPASVPSGPTRHAVADAPSRLPAEGRSDGRYLVDRDGRPFLIVGDSPQALIANVSETQADRFFANRQAAGFNSVWINLLCDDYTGGRADGTTYDGIAPFTRPGDLSDPESRLLRARGRHDPPCRQAQARGVPRSDRDRRLAQASCEATARPRPTTTVATWGGGTGGTRTSSG